MIYKISTTGAQDPVILDDLGGRRLDHPTVDLDLGLEYSDDELLDSADLQAAIDAGYITQVQKANYPLTDVEFETVTSGNSFVGLSDTPDSYSSGRYAVTTGSGIEFDTNFLDYILYVSSSYSGEYRDGSITNPFNSITEMAVYSLTTYTGTENVGIMLMPGEYIIDTTIFAQSPTTKAIMGMDPFTTILKPTASMAGQVSLGTYVPVSLSNVTLDGTDVPELLTTSGTVGYSVQEGDYNQVDIRNVYIKGFKTNLELKDGSNVYMNGSDISNCGVGVVVGSGSLFDSDNSYIYDCTDKHVWARNDCEVYLEGTELYTWDLEDPAGTAVYAEDEAYVELFGGTNIWGVHQNLYLSGDSTIRVDNCVLEETSSNPGIEQKDSATLVILNSRAPLSSDNIDVDNPDNVYIDAFDSTNEVKTTGPASDVDSTLIKVNLGSATDPRLKYVSDHNGAGHRALVYNDPTDGQANEIAVEATNEAGGFSAASQGANAWSHPVYLDLYGDQFGSRRGWRIVKDSGGTPSLSFKYLGATTALKLNYDGTLNFNSGASVNKILDEDGLNSNDAYALVTQQSVKAYIDNNYYSSTVLDSGQLDNRYYTETEVDDLVNDLITTTASGYIKRDGTTELTADWDVGDYEISAAGFNKGNAEVDSANFANATGLLTGGTISINVDPTKLDVASGTCLYVNMTDRDNPYVETLSWDATTVDSTLSGVRSKWAGIYRVSEGVGGVITDTDFTQLEKRTIAVLGRYWGNGTDTITGKGQYSTGAFNFAKTTEDLAYGLGSFNIRGNVISAGSESMRINRSAGQAVRYGARYSTNPTSPNVVDSTDQSNLSVYQYHLQGQNFTTVASGIDPNNYDVGGVKTAVTAGNWTAQRVYYFPGSSNVHIVYAQCSHPTKSLAENCIQQDNLVLNESILEGSILVAYLVLKQGCNDLTDSDQAEIIKAIDGIPALLPGKVNHGQLGGLDDDDHPQYFNEARGDLRYPTRADMATCSGNADERFLWRNGSKELTADWDAGSYGITASHFVWNNAHLGVGVYSSATGLLSGGALSINSGNADYLDISAGAASYIDMTDPTDPIAETITWSGTTVDGALGSNFYKWVGIYRTGPGTGAVIVDTDFTALERRTVAVLGKYWSTVSGSNITNTAGYANLGYGQYDTSLDFMESYGAINVYGNAYSASTDTSMTLARTSGQAFRLGANRGAQPTSPNVYDSPAQLTIPSYYYQISGSYQYDVRSVIDPNTYDLNGVQTSVPTDKWTVQRIYYFAVSNVTVMLWGQNYYDSATLARDGIFDDDFDLWQDTVRGGILRGYLIVKQGATDLTDSDQAVVIEALGRDGVLPGISNHGLLGGLGDDDHPQYFNEARGDLRYPTRAEMATCSGNADERFVWRNGSKELTANWDAGDYLITASGFASGNARVDYANYSNITGILTGGELSINAVDNTKIDVAAGTSLYVNMDDRDDPRVEIISWPDQVYYPAISGIDTKWIGVERTGPGTGQIVSSHKFSQSEKRKKTILGRVWNFIDTDEVIGVGNYKAGAFNAGKTVQDLSYALGSLNISGNVFYPAASGTLILGRTEGEAFRAGANYSSDNISPNIYTSPPASGISDYSYHIQGVASHSHSTIQPNEWDNAGVENNVPTDKWTVQRVYYYPVSNVVVVTYGQAVYDDYDAAYDGASSEEVVLNTGTLEGAILRAFLILKEGCTDLTDSDQAVVIEAVSTAAGGAAGGGGDVGVDDHGNLDGLGDDDHIQYMRHDGTRNFSDKVKYAAHPTFTVDTELVDKKYVDDEIDSLTTDHGELTGLSDDDHTQYSKADGTRNYTGIVSYDAAKTFTTDAQIVDKKYVDDIVVTDHGGLAGLGDDDHPHYSKADGTRNYTGKVSYSSHPTFVTDTEIVDKKYVDDEIDNLTTDHGELTGLSDDDHTQYHNNTRGDARYYTQAQLNNGQLDSRYYTESETDAAITAAVITDHGGLTGLGDDDHTQYTRADGTRDFTNKISYSSHPTFISDTEIVDKKYVDDEIDNLTTDHGELTGLSDDDHTQYHNDTRGDARYYTKTQSDTNLSNHHAPSSTDHDDRYYTETETDGLLTTLSGALQDNIDAIETGDLPVCQVRRTTNFTFPGSWGDCTFDTTDVENDTDILEHDDSNTERINIKETGLYLISYKFQVLRSSTNYSYSRVQKNGTTVLAGSESEVNTYTNEIQMLSNVFVASLQANDYVTLQAYENTTGSTTATDDTNFMVVSLRGLRGEKGDDGADGADGPPGTGSTINVSQDGALVAGGVSNVNFTGTTVTSGISYTTVDVGGKTIQCYSTNTTNLNSATPVVVGWTNQDLIDTDTFTHSTTVNNGRLYVDKAGWYEVSYNIYYAGATGRTNVRGRVRKNGTTYLGRGTSVNYTRNSANAAGSIGSGSFLVELAEDDYIEIITDEQGDAGTCSMVANDNYVRLTLFRAT
jgi:hypothetical protein